MRSRLGRLLMVTLLVGAVAAGPAALDPAAAAAPVKRTVVTYVNPVSGKTHLIHRGYKIAKKYNGGECQGSNIIDGAYRCFSHSLVFDPCWPFRFSNSDFSGFVCLGFPWSKSLSYLRLASSDSSGSTRGHTLWGVQLRNGARCSALSGAVDMYHGQGYRFGCSDGRALIGAVDTHHRQWRVKAVSKRQGKRFSATVNITRAWFGTGQDGR